MMSRRFCPIFLSAIGTAQRVALCLALMLCSMVKADGSLMQAASKGILWKISREALTQKVSYSPVDNRTCRFRKGRFECIQGLTTGDVVIQWDEKGSQIEIVNTTVYNKGDDGEIDRAAFENLLKSSLAALSAEMKVEPKSHKVGAKDAGVKPRAWVWENDNCAVMLEAFSSGSGKKYVAEFIRLTIAPKIEDMERGGAADAAKKSELKEHVKKESDGTVWIADIPMVDQGEKGYCVPAALSRVFAYYGMDGVDQHALAALCKSSGDGTTLDAMTKAIRTISNSFHVSVKPWKWVDMKKLAKDYERLAVREKKDLYNLDPEVLLQVIRSKPNITKKAMKDVRGFVDAGVPIVWGVMLGMYPEQGLPQSFGGHMRLIIGYNEKEKLIVYSDSWGARHEKKTMPLDQACAITQALFVLRPMR